MPVETIAMGVEHVYSENPQVAKRNIAALHEAGLNIHGKKVLDLGCGTGSYAALLSQAGAARVLGVDKELSNIELARRLHATCGLEYLCADLETWPDWGRFDLVFLRGTIYYLSAPPAQTLARLRECLEPDGQLFLTFIDASYRAKLLNFVKTLAAALPHALHSPVRGLLSRLYLALVHLSGDSPTTLEEVRGKMSTLFFPLLHLVSEKEAREMLERQGFAVLAVLRGQGQHQSLSDEYGILARLEDQRS